MNSCCAFAFPLTSLPKFSSDTVRTTACVSTPCTPTLSGMNLTIGLLPLRCLALAYCTHLLQIDVPALLLSSCVLQLEAEYRLALFQGILFLGFADVEGVVDGVEGRRGRKVVCLSRQSRCWVSLVYVPFLTPIVRNRFAEREVRGTQSKFKGYFEMCEELPASRWVAAVYMKGRVDGHMCSKTGSK